jgi:hypothetical protein
VTEKGGKRNSVVYAAGFATRFSAAFFGAGRRTTSASRKVGKGSNWRRGQKVLFWRIEILCKCIVYVVVIGLGLLAARDTVVFLRYGGAQDGNPCAGDIRHSYAFGASQSGRWHCQLNGVEVSFRSPLG